MNLSQTALENFRAFKPSGPVSQAFLKDRSSLVKAILGPVGGGKSVTCTYDSIRRPSFMPACRDGIVRYRRAIIGSTYGQLERNLYPTWWRWVPKDAKNEAAWFEGEWQGGGGRFAIHKLEWDVPRRQGGTYIVTRVRAEYIFAAIGDLAVEEFMRGFEPTDFWFYEMDQIPEAAIDVAITRIMRYPGTSPDDDPIPDTLSKGVGFTPQIVGDLNAPDTDSWFYRKFEEDPAPGFKVYKQPSGLSPQAENIDHLPANYYDRQVETLSRRKGGKNLVQRMVHAQYAPSSAGDPVYQDEYDDAVHFSRDPIKPLPNVPLLIGFDQGLGHPAAVIGQDTPQGQTRILGEIAPGRMSARRFAREVRQWIMEHAPGVPLAEVHYADPAGFTGADSEDGELAWAEIVGAELGIVIQPTETNEIEARLTAVSDDLTYMIAPGVPAIVISTRCKILRKGFVSNYMYEKKPELKSQPTKPVKNHPWGDVHDALQYRQLGRKGRYGVVAGRQNPAAPERAIGHKSRGGRLADDGCTVIKSPVQF